jgi:hypothetical protein
VQLACLRGAETHYSCWGVSGKLAYVFFETLDDAMYTSQLPQSLMVSVGGTER